ncbi:glycoside hydrolase family 28 protein [Colletotrichum karsti]|uniref:galacturonan 1,4-alpha-galacturonidase n=1 Tax=Colletotrichum karsti TaxID=1095194 RepID=A0A9P6HW64_9PEZI|nr:glycoside hydrolase family 28 protein [Colletotrichum karsti]KAF9871494.1 glycoside hydrolase family 28 protein [Colletotrichum karsti]
MAAKTLISVISVLSLVSSAAGLTCQVAGGASDDSPAILAALKQCNNGGTVVLDNTYTIGSVLKTDALSNIAIQLSGTISLSTDLNYWQKNSIQLGYQDAYTAWAIGGSNIHIYGGGSYNGGGDAWYSAGKTGPIMLTLLNAKNVLIEHINMNKSPFWHNLVDGCTNVTYSHVNMNSVQTSGKQAQNTDGWDTYRSSQVTITDCTIINGDDCVSFKPNSTDILVQNLYCQGSHGISVGSLGQYAGQVDIVKNVHTKNVTMVNASNGARIKAWGGSASATSTKGGGTGLVQNITFEDFVMKNVDLPVVIDQCYMTSADACAQHPSGVRIADVHYVNVAGTGGKASEVVSMVCSDVCEDITATGTRLVGTKGTSEYICKNIASVDKLDFPCSATGVTVGGTSKTSKSAKPTSTKH